MMYVRQLIVDLIVCITLYSVLAYGVYALWLKDKEEKLNASEMICYIPNTSFEHLHKNSFYGDENK